MPLIALWVLALASQSGDSDARVLRLQQFVSEIRASGRVVEIGEGQRLMQDPRREVAPGVPPVLAFRYFQGVDRHRFSNLDVMLDDAGH